MYCVNGFAVTKKSVEAKKMLIELGGGTDKPITKFSLKPRKRYELIVKSKFEDC